MTKNTFDKILSKKYNLFSVNKNIKNNVLVIDRSRPISIAKSALIISIITKKLKINPLIFSYFPKSSWQFKLYKIFGDFKFIHSRNYNLFLKNSHFLLISLFKSIKAYLTWKNDILGFINNFSIKKIKIGHLIYDEYIRDNFKYKEFRSLNLGFLLLLFKKIFLFYKLEKIIKQNNIKLLVCCSIEYASSSSLASRVAASKKIPILHIDGQFHLILNQDDLDKSFFKLKKNEFKAFYKNKKKINFKTFIKKRFSGKLRTIMAGNKDLINANINKVDISRENFLKIYAKNTQYKKIVLIAPHAFTDANHGIGKRFIFEGYYDQLKKTVEFAFSRKNNDILWVINPHPTGPEYGEEGQVEEIVKKYKKNNIILLPKNIKTFSAIKFSDLIVTGRGTIGIESASLGKKVIIAGYAIYEKLGFTVEPKNQKEYFNSLTDEKNFKKQSKKNINKALKYLYYFDRHNSYNLPSNPMDQYSTYNNRESLKKNKFYSFLFNFLDEKKYLTNDYYQMIDKIINKIKI